MNGHEFWDRLQTVLDNRRDPLADAELQQFLLDHPELLEQVVAMRANLEALEKPPTLERSSSHSVRRRRVAVAGAALGLICAIGYGLATDWRFRSNGPSTQGSLPDISLPEIAAEGTILRYSIRHYTQNHHGVVEHRVEAGELSIQEQTAQSWTTPAALSATGYPVVTEHAHMESRARPENAHD